MKSMIPFVWLILVLSVDGMAGPVPFQASALPYYVGTYVNAKTGGALVPLYFGLLLQTNNVGAKTSTPAGNGITNGYDIQLDPVRMVVSWSNPNYSLPFQSKGSCFAPAILGSNFNRLCQNADGTWSLGYLSAASNNFIIFDHNGRLYRIVKDGIVSRTFQYDSSNRLVGWSDQFGNQLSYSYASSNLSSISYGGRTFSLQYDSNNNLLSITGSSPLFQAAYVGNAMPSSVTLNDVPQTLLFGYDATGNINSFSNSGNSFSFSYSGNSTTTTSNGVSTVFTFDSSYRPSSIVSGTQYEYFTYIDNFSELESQDNFNGITTAFQRNAFGEVVASFSGGLQILSISYDAAGRPLNESGDVSLLDTYNALEQILTSSNGGYLALTYDSNACINSSYDGTALVSYTNNLLCQITSSGQVSMTYLSGPAGFAGVSGSMTYSSGHVVSTQPLVTAASTKILTNSKLPNGTTSTVDCVQYDLNWLQPSPSLSDMDPLNFPGAPSLQMKNFFSEAGQSC